MFLAELPPEAVQNVDLSATGASALDAWRSGSEAARQGWSDAGIGIPLPVPPRRRPEEGGFTEGMLVRHPTYGTGRVVEVSGFGSMRRVKIRFRTAGLKTFVADKAQLEVVQEG